MEEKKLSPREQAIKAIKDGGSVVIGGKQYILDNIDELPPLEQFVAGDSAGEAEALASLRREKEELEKRLAAFEGKSSAKAEAPKEEKKASSSKSADESESK